MPRDRNHTSLYLLGYRYYVYVRPGVIEYFRTLGEAQDFAATSGGTLGEVD